VNQILTFARGAPVQKTVVQTRHLLTEIARIIQETFPKAITLDRAVPPDLWTVQGDPTQLHQVLMNLCVNARDAMPAGGTLTLAAENVVLDESFARVTLDAKPGPYVAWLVADTGTGIAPAVLDRMFDPFFTTKEVGKGTGLGLSTVLGIVRRHEGFVRVESQVGQGTQFRVYLPAAHAPVAAAVAAAALPQGRGQLVLVVDDEAGIRSATRSILERNGYRVLTANDGAEALGLFTQRQREIAVVLTDLLMPRMGGVALAAALKRLDPRVKILGSSGSGREDDQAALQALGVESFLPKPYAADKLLQALQQVLSPPG
jgi:two-component system cell cycle sensor histidine kinase/response regulator CckA